MSFPMPQLGPASIALVASVWTPTAAPPTETPPTETGEGTTTPLILSGDPLPPHGTVVRVDRISVADGSAWLAGLATRFQPTVHVSSGTVVAVSGAPLAQPLGATLAPHQRFRQTLNNRGQIAGTRQLVAGGTQLNGVFVDEHLLIAEGDVAQAPEFPPGTRYTTLTETRLNDSDELVFAAIVERPGLPTGHALVRLELDPEGSHVLSEHVVVQQGDILPGQSDPVQTIQLFEPAPFDLNNLGQVLYAVTIGPILFEVRYCIYLDDELVGESEDQQLSQPLDLNDAGDYLFTRRNNGNPFPDAYYKNGAPFVEDGNLVAGREVDLLPSIPAKLDDVGRVLWFGRWDGRPTRNSGFFLDGQLVFEEGVTSYAGTPIDFGASSATSYFDLGLRPDGSAFAVGGYLRADPDEEPLANGFFLTDLPR